MLSFLKNNFEVYEIEGEEVFQYRYNGNVCVTNLDFFINNLDKFEGIISFWESEGYDVPH